MFSKLNFVLVMLSVLSLAHLASAERMPDKPEDATHVVKGTVKRVYSRETKDQIQYIVEVKIDQVERPASIKPGELISVYCFQAKRPEKTGTGTAVEKAESWIASIGESGHSAVPQEGQQIRAMAKPRGGRLEGLYPDWFTVIETKPKLGAQEPQKVENSSEDAKGRSSQTPQKDDSSPISGQDSEQYYFETLQRGKGFRIKKEAAVNYLRGVWRLDRKAHMSGGHSTRADQGDDVSLVCTEKQLIQIDFNRNKPVANEFVAQLSDLKQDERGRFHFDNHRLFAPVSEDHLLIGRYDYVVLLKRVSVKK